MWSVRSKGMVEPRNCLRLGTGQNSLAPLSRSFHNKAMSESVFPRMITVGQEFPPSPKLDIDAVVQSELKRTIPKLNKGAKIAVAVGSRGISNLQAIVRAAIRWLKASGAEPYIIPA